MKDSIIPSWNLIAKIGNNRIIKSSYYWMFFVPIVAKFVENFPERFSYSIGKTNFDLTLSLPFSWKILFYSSLCFGLATLLYSWRCPDLVKKIKSYEEFKKIGLTSDQLLLYLSNWFRNGGIIRTAENDIVSKTEAIKSIYSKFTEGNMPPSALDENEAWRFAKYIPIRQKHIAESFWYIKGLMYNDKKNWRVFISLLYLIGFALFAILLVTNIFYVASVTFQ